MTAPSGLSVAPLVARLLGYRRMATVGALVGLMGAVTLGVLRGPQYAAESMFRPQGSKRSPLSGLAAQIGINLPGLVPNEPVMLYARILKAREVLREAALTVYHFPETEMASSDSLNGTIAQLYGLRGRTAMDSLRNVLDFMNKSVFVGVDARSELVTIRTTARWPGLAVAVNRRLLELVNLYNSETRRSQARAEREFIAGRIVEAQSALHAAEDSLQRFMERNVRYQQSPALMLDAGRLQRRVDLQQEVYTTLAQAFEQARVDEVRDTPVVTLVDPPETSVRKSRGLTLYALLGLVIGAVAGLATGAFRDFWQDQGRGFPRETEAIRNMILSMVRPFRAR